MAGCGRGICIWLETIILENAPWLQVVIVWLNDLKAGRGQEIHGNEQRNGSVPDSSF